MMKNHGKVKMRLEIRGEYGNVWRRIYFIRAPMNALVKTICRFVTSSIGRKVIVAITGACLVMFLAGHLIGNLTIYGGPEWINSYAYGLHSMPGWALRGIRAGVAAMFVIHILLTAQLKLENIAAREPYQYQNTITATLSSRYMIYTGLTVAAFLIYHLLQYTVRVGYDEAHYMATIAGDVQTFNVYQMVVDGFRNVWCSAFYIIAVAMLFSHLRHGVQSIFQSVGLNSRKIRPVYNLIAIAYALVVCAGFISIPVAVLLGIIK